MSLRQVFAGVLGCSGVILGAVAAHAVSDAHGREVLGQAGIYLLIHAAVLLALPSARGLVMRAAVALMLTGLLVFCGSLCLRYLGGWDAAGGAAPFGGGTLILGWALVAVGGLGKRA